MGSDTLYVRNIVADNAELQRIMISFSISTRAPEEDFALCCGE